MVRLKFFYVLELIMVTVTCSTCGEVQLSSAVIADKSNKKKSVVTGTCPSCGKHINEIKMDMSKK